MSEAFSPFSGRSSGFENSSVFEGANEDDFESDDEDQADEASYTEEAGHRSGVEFAEESEGSQEYEDEKEEEEYTEYSDNSADSPRDTTREDVDASVGEPSQSPSASSLRHASPSEGQDDDQEYSDDAENEYSDEYQDDFDDDSPVARHDAKVLDDKSSAVGRYVTALLRKTALRRWGAEVAPAEAEDEIAAIIAAARAAVDRPVGATSATTCEELSTEAPSAGRHAVEFGPVGTPPPDDAQPGWLRDSGVQCGVAMDEWELELQETRPPETPVFSAAYPPKTRPSENRQVAHELVQTLLSGPTEPGLSPRGSFFARSMSCGRLETVEEREEAPPTPDTPVEKPPDVEAEEKLPSAAPGNPSPTARASRPRQPEKRRARSRSRSPKSLSPVQPLRVLPPHEQEAPYSGLSQAPSSTLAFGRRLQGRRPTPPGSEAFSWSEMSEDLLDESSGFIAPIPAGHLHRICDPFAKRSRPVWFVNRSWTPRSSERARRVLPPLPKGPESRPPQVLPPEIRTEVHSVMAQRRAKDWLMADNLRLRNTATEQDFSKRGVAAGAIYYAKSNTRCLQSLGAGGNFPGGRR